MTEESFTSSSSFSFKFIPAWPQKPPYTPRAGPIPPHRLIVPACHTVRRNDYLFAGCGEEGDGGDRQKDWLSGTEEGRGTSGMSWRFRNVK
ncbi:hypothetical protein GWI33_008641 [Rhynchophorus ferrugineus]|uniref:Uncharacterized protein n=1 Tax=Rhynchophorus ferrugineus TaxID=354439 RepID=A0A834MAY8_RHYFE|nr:hypothetical protein GWI33_008641 [Rhynchophorus ferrugineus]